MKKNLIVVCGFFYLALSLEVASAFSPSSYYKSTEGLEGYRLKTELSKIITRGHQPQSYRSLINFYFISDKDTEYDKDGSIVDMYSEILGKTDPFVYRSRNKACGTYKGEGDCFNREHIVPQSVFRSRSPMQSDIFHVYPSDGYVNNRRANFPFGVVTEVRWTSKNGSKVGKNPTSKYKGLVFEPIDEFKGDIARALFYFATRYEKSIRSWSHPMFNGTSNQVFSDWFLKILLDWHDRDEVSPHEKQRNEHGYKFQGNRNPFIDDQDFVERIW